MGPYFTWHDVQRVLEAVEAPPWKRILIGPTGVQIHTEPEKEEAALQRLRCELGAAYDDEAIDLVSVNGRPRRLPVSINPVQLDLPLPTVARPLWSSRHAPSPHPQPDDPPVVAFFSYKGGVGRTTTTIALVAELLSRTPPARLLLVDADLEAPGLTWLMDRHERLCLLDVMALVHEADDWRREALPTVVGLLRANRLHLELPAGRRELLFLPAMRVVEQALAPPVTFEQMVRARGRATVVGDLFLALGRELDLDAVVIDLRAGMTELSSPLLFDPRVRSVLVTSCNPQSVDGTLETLRACRSRAPAAEPPEVVVTLVPPDAPEVAELVGEQVLEVFDDFGDLEAVSDLVTADLRFDVHAVKFAQELIHYDDLEDLVRRRLPGTELAKRVAPELASRLVPEVHDHDDVGATPEPTPRDIARAAARLEVAEDLEEPGLLPIPALRHLYEQPGGRLPAAVVLGPKGAGKTFAWGQMVLAKMWHGFGKLLGSTLPEKDARVFPLLAPRHMGDKLRSAAREAEQLALGSRECRLSRDELTRRLETPNGGDGLQFWLDAIVDRLGLPPEASRSVRDLNRAVVAIGVPLVLVVDGLEDAFQPSPGKPLSDEQRRMLRALLVDLPNGILDQGQTDVGIVTFVRRDLAEDAIPQNFRQFERLHSDYQLRWSPADALRLPAWLLALHGWQKIGSIDDVTTASDEDLRKLLVPFWGEKMGGKSEAYTDRWVIAALSDLKGRLQARDVIRLIRFAAEKTPNQWPLSHRAIRDALLDCSKLKLQELEREIKGLAPILKKLREQPPERQTVPFTAASVGLADDEVRFMELHGLVTQLEHGDLWYMPEIVRPGLGYKLEKGARPKILRMYRMAQQRRR